jgi:hypothetical protein
MLPFWMSGMAPKRRSSGTSGDYSVDHDPHGRVLSLRLEGQDLIAITLLRTKRCHISILVSLGKISSFSGSYIVTFTWLELFIIASLGCLGEIRVTYIFGLIF